MNDWEDYRKKDWKFYNGHWDPAPISGAEYIILFCALLFAASPAILAILVAVL